MAPYSTNFFQTVILLHKNVAKIGKIDQKMNFSFLLQHLIFFCNRSKTESTWSGLSKIVTFFVRALLGQQVPQHDVC
jgi:hypothetical protein